MKFPTMAVDGLHRPIIPLLVESPGGKQLIVDALVDTDLPRLDVTRMPKVKDRLS